MAPAVSSSQASAAASTSRPRKRVKNDKSQATAAPKTVSQTLFSGKGASAKQTSAPKSAPKSHVGHAAAVRANAVSDVDVEMENVASAESGDEDEEEEEEEEEPTPKASKSKSLANGVGSKRSRNSDSMDVEDEDNSDAEDAAVEPSFADLVGASADPRAVPAHESPRQGLHRGDQRPRDGRRL